MSEIILLAHVSERIITNHFIIIIRNLYSPCYNTISCIFPVEDSTHNEL